MMNFEVYKEDNNEYFFRMVNDTEEILTSLAGFRKKEIVFETIEEVKKNAPVPSSIEKMETASGEYFFTILDSRGRIVCKSTLFYSPHLRDKWVNDIQKELPQLNVVEI